MYSYLIGRTLSVYCRAPDTLRNRKYVGAIVEILDNPNAPHILKLRVKIQVKGKEEVVTEYRRAEEIL